jgi:class 3 adenylate cyclase
LLRRALAHFDAIADYSNATRTQFEIARTLAASDAVRQLITDAYLEALRRAEDCRRTELVSVIEEELRGIDEEAHWQHVFRRVRGQTACIATSSLAEGVSEEASVLFFSLKAFMSFCKGLEPEEVMQTLNQLLAELEAVLERFDAHVLAHQGGGFLAVVRGVGREHRAVDAALEMIAVVEGFNRPRTVLGLPRLPVQVGIAGGLLFLCNIGTYRKLEFSAVGTPVNRAARLVEQANEQSPCISREIYEVVKDRFVFSPESPRTVELRGLSRGEIWDVLRRKEAPSRPRP